jgi:hypothetical protein
MVNWICYPNGDEPDMWTAWHRLQDGAVRAKHATAMRFLTAGIWKMPHYRPLTGKHVKGLGEIRVRGDVQWRLIGFRDTGKDTFTIVMICNHKGGVYKPVDAFEISADRRKEMLNGLRGVALNVHPN